MPLIIPEGFAEAMAAAKTMGGGLSTTMTAIDIFMRQVRRNQKKLSSLSKTASPLMRPQFEAHYREMIGGKFSLPLFPNRAAPTLPMM